MTSGSQFIIIVLALVHYNMFKGPQLEGSDSPNEDACEKPLKALGGVWLARMILDVIETYRGFKRERTRRRV